MTDTCNADTVSGDPCKNSTTDDGDPERCWIPSHNEQGAENPHGRPSKLDLQRQEEIAQAVEQGKSFSLACRKAGITPSTGIRWLQEGEEQEEGEYREFFERLTRAKGHGQDVWESRLLEVADDPATIMAILKTQYPDEWGDAKRGDQAGSETVINIPDSVAEKWQRHKQRQN